MKAALLAAAAIACLSSAPGALAQEASPAQAKSPSFAWMSLDVSDVERAKRFYVDALGMKQAMVLSKPTDPFQKIGFNFTGNPASGEPLLILVHYDNRPQAAAGAPKGTMLGLIVPDVHVAAAQVRSAGYTVLREPPADAKGPVLTAIARDPDGTIVEITQLSGPVTGK